MYRLLDIIKKVSSYIIYRNELILSNDSKVKINGLVLENISSSSFNVQNDKLLFLDKSGLGYLYDNKVLKELNLRIYKKTLIGNTIISYSYNEFRTKNIYLFNVELNTKELINERLDFYDVFRNDNFLFFDGVNSSSLISNLNIETKEIEWQTDLSQYGEIRDTLGVVGDKLWIVMFDSEIMAEQPIALCTQTGVILVEASKELPFRNGDIKLLVEKERILGIPSLVDADNTPFVELDARTGEVLRNENIVSIDDLNYTMRNFQYLDGLLYCTLSMSRYINSTHIGVIDYDTLELLWSTEVKERLAGLSNMQVTKDKIYFQDEGNQLHIYERTAMEE